MRRTKLSCMGWRDGDKVMRHIDRAHAGNINVSRLISVRHDNGTHRVQTIAPHDLAS
jgi:hypothetical protein